MRDQELQAKTLGIEEPWSVTDVVLTMEPKRLTVGGFSYQLEL